MIHFIDDLEKKDLEGKKVLLRLDLNSPILNGEVSDTNRLERVIDTVDFLRMNDAEVIILSHLEDNLGKNQSLLPILNYLNGYFPVEFSTTYFTPEAKDKLLNMKKKSVLLFENIRYNPGEKENDPNFSKKLSEMSDIYVNDAFGVSHRKHASIVGVPKLLPHYGGLLLRDEIQHLSKVFNSANHTLHPFVFIIGGAKFETKLPLIKKYLERADSVFVGGALAHDIFKAKGYEVGTSLVSNENFGIDEITSNKKLVTPIDVTVTKGDLVSSKDANDVSDDECIVDAGPKTIDQLKDLLKNAKTIVWNGPLGNYERKYTKQTEDLARIIANLTVEKGATSIVGGGDTIASINELNINRQFSFISTGGGAMLDYLVNETLPGIESLEND